MLERLLSPVKLGRDRRDHSGNKNLSLSLIGYSPRRASLAINRENALLNGGLDDREGWSELKKTLTQARTPLYLPVIPNRTS